MILYESIFRCCRPWCEEEWWFSRTPSRKEKLRGDTSLANMKVTLRVASVQNASTVMSSIRRTSSGGSMRGPPGAVAAAREVQAALHAADRFEVLVEFVPVAAAQAAAQVVGVFQGRVE